MWRFYGCLFFLLSIIGGARAQVVLRGSVLGLELQPVPNAQIIVKETGKGTTADGNGMFQLTLPARQKVGLRFEAIGYEPLDTVVATFEDRLPPMSILLDEQVTHIEQVSVIGQRRSMATLEHIDVKTISTMRSSSLGIENLVKTLPGVQSSNELSSQYSVRGGSFDENLVYIDGIEVYRPTLIRSGNQEGLSVINPDMVEKLTFSAGGFPAYYGDKMSSVLSIQYRTPRESAARFQLGLLENRVLLEGATPSKELGAMVGLRYKTTQLLLNTSDLRGDYSPSFFDLQGKCHYHLSSSFSWELVWGLARNAYRFVPKKKTTNIPSFSGGYSTFMVYYEGKEEDLYNTAFANTALRFRPTTDWELGLTLSTFHTAESESFDILGEYWLGELLPDEKSYLQINDSLASFGIGGTLDHARNRFNAWVNAVQLGARYEFGNHVLRFGLESKNHTLAHRLNEWHVIDSAGYTLPRRALPFDDRQSMRSAGELEYQHLAGHGHLHLQYDFWNVRWEIDGGVRISTRRARDAGKVNWDTPRVSPRLAFTMSPEAIPNLSTYFATGFYYQYPFYREMRDRRGSLYPTLAPQRALHFVLGGRWSFPTYVYPFRVQLELFQKNLSSLIPYTVENLSLRYEAANIAEGMIRGIDLKVHGELVPGAESWMSLSLLKASMQLTGSPRDAALRPEVGGDFPMPSDQRLALSFFLQDYLPGLPSYSIHITGHYASGLPFTPPSAPYGTIGRLPAYKRADVGFEKVFKSEQHCDRWLQRINWLREFSVGIEVLNLLDLANTSSLLWVTVPKETGGFARLAVPNYLTARCVNVRLLLGF